MYKPNLMNTRILLRKSNLTAYKIIGIMFLFLLNQTWSLAQTFPGSIVNTAGNSLIPSSGTGGCTIAPQNTGGTTFNNTVVGLGAVGVASVLVNFTHTFDSDLDFFLVAPNGQTIELSTDNGAGNDNYTNTNFVDGSPNITTGAAPFTGNFAPEGTLTADNCGVIITPTITTLAAFTTGQNGVWQLRFLDDVGGDIGTMLNWSITFGAIVPPCLLVTPANLTVSAAAGVCTASPIVNIPATNPAGCFNGTGTGLRYNINGGPFTNVIFPATTVTFTNLPGGINTIIWQTYNVATGVTVSAVTQLITVLDTTPPTVNCPASLTVNLDPGACSAIVDYVVTATDNCAFAGPSGQVNTIKTGGNGNSAGGMIWFNVNNLTTGNIIVTQLAMNISNATVVNVYRKAGTHVGFETNMAAWTLVATPNANVGPFSGPFPGNGTITPVNTSFIIPPGLHGIGLHTVSASSNYTNGTGGNQMFSDANIILTLGS